jgi:predicted glycoside hydrolase/deacetylase ChbG (UPF0249 family)
VTPKLLVINADDFGFAPDVNAAIEELHQAGRITNTTLMVDGKHVDEALKIAHRNPSLGVGLHLDLCPVVGLYSLPYQQMREDLRMPGTLDRVADEVTRQINKFKGFGLDFHHMDGHRHFHALPELFALVVEVAAGHGLKTIRFNKDWILPRTPSVYLEDDFFRASIRLLERHNVAYGKFINGWWDYSAADVDAGWNELMVHVGYEDEHYSMERQRIASAEFLQEFETAGVQLHTYSEMAQSRMAGAGRGKD